MSQLRSFAFLGKTAPTAIVIPTGSAVRPFNIADIEANVGAAGFLQFFDQVAAPVNPNVPTKVIQVTAAGPIANIIQALGPIRFVNGVWVAMSSTETVYTAVATAYDIEGEVEEWELPRDGVTVVGDYTTTQASLQIWVTGTNPPKTLLRATITESAGVASFVQLFATNPGANEKPLYPEIPIAANATLDLFFNVSPFKVNAPGTGPANYYSTLADQSIKNGCTIGVSQTSGLFDNAGSATIRAEYKNNVAA